MSGLVTCRIDSQVAQAMNEARAHDGTVGVGILLKEDLRPAFPWTYDQFRAFDRLVEDILSRVEDTVGPHPHNNHAGAYIDPARGAFRLGAARVSFLDELLKQPEIAECVDRLKFMELPETEAKGLA
jgi:hypothetical protein